VVVQFDRPLQADPALDVANWTVRLGNFLQVVSSAVAAGSIVTLQRTNGPGQPGADVVSFAPPPDDVISAAGLPAAAFSDLPIVTIPP
jgi:hypothetical protein